MQIGISTASFFTKKNTEDAIEFMNENDISVAEVFLSTYSEYTSEFAELLLKKKGKVKVHSIHTLTTQFEPQLYSGNPRAREDAFGILENVLSTGHKIGAKYYTFHGVARNKKSPIRLDTDYDFAVECTQNIIKTCHIHGVELSYENVHWCYYNHPGLFSELKKECPELKGVLDIKQAWQSGYSYLDYIEDMGKDIVTVHISDRDENGKMCLPLKGSFDFDELFKTLKYNGFDGAVMLEVYPENYNNFNDLFASYYKIKSIASKYY